MGLTGASAAKRKAKRMAADAYYKALKDLKPADRLNRADTKAARTLDEQIGDDVGGNTRILAKKADKAGRALNKDREAFNEKVDRYNERHSQLQRQMEGRPTAKRNGDSSALVGWKQERLAEIDAEVNKLSGEESAYRATKSKVQQAIQGLGNKQEPLTQEQQARGKRLGELRQERAEVERGSKWIGNHYRHLNNLEDTYDEVATLAKEVGGYERKGDGLIARRTQEAETRELLNRSAPENGLPGMLKLKSGSHNAALPQISTGLASMSLSSTKPFDPENMELDKGSAGYRVTQTAEMYSGIADKLRTAVQRDASRAAMNKVKQPVDQLGSEVIDPNANPVTAELLS